MTTREHYRNRALFGIRNLLGAVIATALVLTLVATARAATITVNSLSDTGSTGICVLRDAITAANTMSATNGCAAGTASDTINFTVTGTIALGSTLPPVTDSQLTISGPASLVTISGTGRVQVMLVGTGATLALHHVRIANGLSLFTGSGGGIYNKGTLTVSNSILSGNSAPNDSGGAIYNDGVLAVTNSTFSKNNAFFAGGAIGSSGKLTITNSTFSGNSTQFEGGGIGAGGTLTIINSTFFENSALSEGGGIRNVFGTLTITNSTFSGNSATAGGGIFNNGPTSFRNTILAGSGGGNCSGTTIDAGYNISDDSSCGFNATGSHNNTDPTLDPAGLINNGGRTKTIALLPGSPAIDAIPSAKCTDQSSPPNPIISDQRLFPRPDAGEANCDIGAYEVQDAVFVHFSQFGGGLTIDPDAGVFNLNGGFKLGSGGSIDPTMQPVAFSVGSYAVRLPAGSFVKHNTGYVYQKTVNGIFLCLFIKFTSTPGRYVLLANRIGGTLTDTISPVPVTLTIGDNSGTTQMNAKFD
jgi:hypothetical protein